MKYPVYSIRDVKVAFGTPFVDMNDQTAIRGFSFSVNSKEGILNANPKDYDLYKIGDFDADSGTIKAFDVPVLVVAGSDVYGK